MSTAWSRRKAAVAAEAEAEALAQEAAARAEQEGQEASKSDAELLADLDLPDPDAVEDADTLRRFLEQGIPQRLKTRALRRFWRLNPVLANLDGLVDYGEDFTDAALVPEVLTTAYQVGRGMTRHIEALAEEARQKAALAQTATDAAPPEEAASADDATEETGPEGLGDEVAPTATTERALARSEDGAIPDTPPARAPRRIRVTYTQHSSETA